MAKKGSMGVLKWVLSIGGVLIVAGIIAWLWFTRPIVPTELTEPEIVTVEEKLLPVIENFKEGTPPKAKSFIITEREMNGYLNHQSEYGDTVQFELVPDQLIVHLNVKIPDDFPVIAGTTLRARCKIILGTIGGTPIIEISELTAFGNSFPEKFLEDYMDRNLFQDLVQRLGITFDINSLGSIQVREDELEILFLQQ